LIRGIRKQSISRHSEEQRDEESQRYFWKRNR
jgi:hypothetical protein